MKKLENKIALVTGAGSGIGRSIAKLFAQEGATVVVCDLQEKELDKVVEEIKSEGGKVKGIFCDLSREDNIKHLFQKCVEEFNRVDFLINNAGVLDDFLPITEISTERWEHVMNVNLTACFHTCRAALTLMLNEKKGVIVNIASVGGLFGARAGVAYTSSKHGLIGLTKNIGFYYAKLGIRCNAIAPGGINTHISQDMKPSAFGYERSISGIQTMPRSGDPKEIASIALFLCTEDASLINGSVITADGGWTAY